MIVFPIVLLLGQAEIATPVPAFWPFTRGTTDFSARYFVLPEPPQSLADVDFGADPDATGKLETLRWPEGQDPFWEGGPADDFAAHFAATLVVEEAGSYSFHLTSDDGSALVLDGTRVIDNDGLHPMIEQSAAVSLAPGRHEVEVLYMEQGGSQGLTFDWAGPDTRGARIPVGAPAAAAPEGEAAPTAAEIAPTVTEAPPAEAVADVSWIETVPHSAAAEGCGFTARFFALSKLPLWLADVDFAAPPDHAATVASLEWPLSAASFWSDGPADGFAAHFATALRVETPGAYSFHLVSDDGSALLVDGAPVIVNDGAHEGH